MKIIEYRLNGNETLYDFNTIKNILKTDRSKLQRDLRRVSGTENVKYKNQYLYKEEILFLLVEEELFKRLDKIELVENEQSKNKINSRSN